MRPLLFIAYIVICCTFIPTANGQYNRNVVGLGQRDPVTGHGITLPLIPQFQLAANNLKEFYENPANDAKLSRGCMRQYMNHKKILPSLPAGHIYYEGYVPWDLECNELKVENIKNELAQLVPSADRIRIVMECENFPPRIQRQLQHQRPCTQFYYTTTHYGEDILAATPANGGRNEPAFYGPFPF